MPPDTWAGELGEYMFLIKAADDRFIFVFGTLTDAMVSGNVETLSEAQALANRFHWLVNNVTPEQFDALISKL